MTTISESIQEDIEALEKNIEDDYDSIRILDSIKNCIDYLENHDGKFTDNADNALHLAIEKMF